MLKHKAYSNGATSLRLVIKCNEMKKHSLINMLIEIEISNFFKLAPSNTHWEQHRQMQAKM